MSIASTEPRAWYDRSSLAGDFLVAIEGQTEADFLERAPENQFCELIDGVVYMPAAAATWHQFDAQFLIVLLEMFAADRPVGPILSGPAVLRLQTGRMLEPDIFVLPDGGESQVFSAYAEPPVLLVVEILSPSNRAHDLVRKAEVYREAGVPEVWFVDGENQVVIVERKTASGYATVQQTSGPLLCRSIPGFWIQVDWLWARPRPNVRVCLEAVLAGGPG
jgi:Uma2 family endonuclease